MNHRQALAPPPGMMIQAAAAQARTPSDPPTVITVMGRPRPRDGRYSRHSGKSIVTMPPLPKVQRQRPEHTVRNAIVRVDEPLTTLDPNRKTHAIKGIERTCRARMYINTHTRYTPRIYTPAHAHIHARTIHTTHARTTQYNQN